MTKVFLSSTNEDLKNYRQVVIAEINKLQKTYTIAMEYFTPDGKTAVQKCYDEVRKCDILVGIYAHRYGWQPGIELDDIKHRTYTDVNGNKITIEKDDPKSITHYEFEWADSLGKKCICFVIKKGHPWDMDLGEADKKKQYLTDFKNEVGNLIRGEFTSEDNLAMHVSTALSSVLTDGKDEPTSEKDESTSESSSTRCPIKPPYNLPNNFGGRDEVIEKLKDELKPGKNIALTAVQGVGGIGKTTIALALAYNLLNDEDSTFKVVLWADITRKATSAVDIMRSWMTRYNPNDPLPDDLNDDDLAALVRRRLETILQDACQCDPKQMLVILDDVWDGASFRVADFLRKRVCPANAPILITTRDRKVAGKMKAKRHEIQYMSDDDGATMLAESLSHVDHEVLKQLSQALRGHTLALNLALQRILADADSDADQARQVQRLTDKYKQGVTDADFESLKLEEGETEEENLELSLSYTYDDLDDDEKRRFRQLGILAFDQPFSDRMLATLWDATEEDDVEDMCSRLLQLGLFETHSMATDADQAEGARWYKQHGLLRAYAKALMTDDEADPRLLPLCNLHDRHRVST